MIKLVESLESEIQRGKEGKNTTIPFPYERLDEYLEIGRNTMYTIGGEPGVGKSTYIQDCFIIRTMQWWIEHRETTNIKLTVVYLNMERKVYSHTSRWLCRLIYENEGHYIHPKKILGKKNYKGEKEELTAIDEGYIAKWKKVINSWQEEVDGDCPLIVHEGSKNASGISIYVEQLAKKYGTIHHKDKEDKSIENTLRASRTYDPHHPNHIVLLITDPIGALSPERKEGKGERKVKQDSFADTMMEARDIYGFSPVLVQHLNRNMSDIHRQKMGNLEPKLSDFADTSTTAYHSEVVLAVFDPYRHGQQDKHNGYDLKKMRNDRGDTYYRSIHILKNSYDAMGIYVSMTLHPGTGILKSLPRKAPEDDKFYDRIINGMYFLEDNR